ncbi:hypothetical protein CICLE_v10006770mg [Citrus x clementina]|uniref:Bifunctional inhibitor/plant lipid transfer protein/seed storage helical domain-containing protein n=1 Tax=Citrus clementina TaxID=85681 RepID=V4S373_CITCL|nr:leucine-rich repeat extensin-like protein 5 [Citrus x clementina]ESR33220.1 hypothetical protein CICLE_v10006770mg [Citrus x clementina]
MKLLLSVQRLVPFLVVALVLPIYGQINNPCTPTMLTTFTPCMNFLTNSSGSGTSPSSDCCGSLKNLTGNSMDCVCLIVTASVPFRVPINRTLAISLPRACNMPSVPVQCKASGAPLPAPGPASLGSAPSPGESPAASPKAPVVPQPTPSGEAPESDTTPGLTPPSSPSPDVGSGSGTPTGTPASRPDLTPSAAMPSYIFSPSLLLFVLGFVVLKYY